MIFRKHKCRAESVQKPILKANLEVKVNRCRALILCLMACMCIATAQAADQPPLKLLHSIPLPQLKEGDFDHFAVDVAGNRLFDTAEENSRVLVFDLKTNKLIHTIQ